MAELVLCAECNRHVRDAACPFCGARVSERGSSALARASRAAIFAIAAAPGLAACHRETVEMYGGPPIPIVPDASASATPSASAQTPVVPTAETAHVTAYGGPPTATAPPSVAPSPQPKR